MKTVKNETIMVKKSSSMQEGVRYSEDKNRVEITLWCKDAKQCKLCLYRDKKRIDKIPMFPMEEQGAPDLFGVALEGPHVTSFLAECEYDFEADGKKVNTPYLTATAGRDNFGKRGRLRGRFGKDDFDWSGEERQIVSYDDMILYQCHLRGFTRHQSSGVKHPGTFSGFTEKLDYIQGLGVNTILFLPLYDFNEMMEGPDKKVNCWGYTEDACYFAPKASYAANPQEADVEMKQMIKEIHKRGMNVLMEIYFLEQSPEFMMHCMRYYVTQYHLDGFSVDTAVIPTGWLSKDPVLRGCKFLGSYWNTFNVVRGDKKFATFNDEYMTVARRYLKSDEGQVSDFYHCFKAEQKEVGRIHYMTQKNGFTLRDLVSYDVKHNDANGEKNLDGTEYNYSWNCGQEGVSRKKSVNDMRRRQTKNALCMLLLGLATPMVLAGDEFGRSQKGNNNAYCQDNPTTWLDWNLLEKNKEIYEFTKKLITFRKQCALYQRNFVMTGMDTKGIGAPDVSAHGIEPWEANFSYYSRELGIMFYGGYIGGKSIYMAFNFHWDSHEFYLPTIARNETWKLLFDTSKEMDEKEMVCQKYRMSPRTIAVFESKEETRRDKKNAPDKKKSDASKENKH